MKYLIHVFLLLGTPIGAFTQANLSGNEFIINGKIAGQNSGYIHLAYTDINGKYKVDSCAISNENFYLKGNIHEPTLARLYGNIKSRSIDDPNFIEIFLEPAFMQVFLNVNHFKKVEVTGSNTQIEYTTYQSRNDSLYNKWKGMFNQLE